jgi:hypothetical protein
MRARTHGTTTAAARRRGALALLLIGVASTAAGLAYWRAAAIDPGDREAARTQITEGLAPRLMEYTLGAKYLTACVDVMSHWTFAVEPTADRRRVSDICAGAARAQRRQSGPTAEAELVFALAAHHAGDRARTLGHVGASQALAPRDLWLTIKRVELVLTALPEGDLARERDYFGGEFSILAGSNRGVNTAVALYAKYPGLRPALLDVAEDMSPGDRLRFLNRVKRVAGG